MKYQLSEKRIASGINVCSAKNRNRNGVWQLNHVDHIPQVRDAVTDLMEELQYGSQDLFAIQLTMEEALVNAFKHGNSMDPGKRVYVSSRINNRQVWIRIEDEGDGFVLADIPDPTLPQYRERSHGRGLLIMRKFLDRLEYNQIGNVVKLCKFRSN